MNRHLRLLLGLAARLGLLLAAISKPAGADGIAIEVEVEAEVVDSHDPHEHDVAMPAPKAILTRKEG
jgi:hypothetical protein